jgi:hypothetical protein
VQLPVCLEGKGQAWRIGDVRIRRNSSRILSVLRKKLKDSVELSFHQSLDRTG